MLAAVTDCSFYDDNAYFGGSIISMTYYLYYYTFMFCSTAVSKDLALWGKVCSFCTGFNGNLLLCYGNKLF